jgi:hypothetical protein
MTINYSGFKSGFGLQREVCHRERNKVSDCFAQMVKSTNLIYICLTAIFFTGFISCEREAFKDSHMGDFSFSTDTVMFDTIFTDLGTPTYKLLIKNLNDFNLEIDSVYLADTTKGFIINVNGVSNLPLRKITIGAKDSLYIFIQAYIRPTQEDAPFTNEDSLIFVSGNNIKKVKLIAFGQNTIHFRDQNIKTQEWTNSRPYLIYGTLTVDSGYKLTINEGVKVYLHQNAKLLVKGSIAVKGTLEHPVHFRSDRLEKDYDTIPGQWGGIIITGASDNHTMDYAVIRNATTGITFGDYKNDAIVKAEVKNTIIANMAYSAIISYQAKIAASNTVLANTGNTTCFLYGGEARFIHCTFANYGARYIARTVDTKTLKLSNYIEQEQIPKDLISAEFINSIIYGSNQNEIQLLNKSGSQFRYNFENCLIHTSEAQISGNNNIINKSPLFISTQKENFRIDSLSPAKNAGNITYGSQVPFDLVNNSRTSDTAPDMGAYERKEKQ